MRKILHALASVFLFPLLLHAQTPAREVQTILFLGNSITYNGVYIANMEACYTLWHPGASIQWLNLGLPSETVSGLSEEGHAGGRFPRPDLHERLHRILSLVKPTIVFACYGMNDGIYLPLDGQRFQQYKNGINWLHDTLVSTGARVIMVTPPVYDELRGNAKGYAHVLDTYANWLLSKKKMNNWEVADIHYPMKNYLEAHRALDVKYGVDGVALAEDGIHPGAAGHWLMAKQLLLYLGQTKAKQFNGVKAAMLAHANGTAIFTLIAERQDFMKDALLTATGHTRPEMKTGMAFPAAQARAAAIGKQIADLLP